MIRYLDKEELGRCRALWREAFPDDSEEFTSYYFDRKINKSRVLVKEDDGGGILTMIHLNPYEVKAGDRQWKLDYIVGVATAAVSRGQGHMRDVLTRMLWDMHDTGAPFCYLMPASPDIYRPFGFTYIFDQPSWKLKSRIPAGAERREIRLNRKWVDSREGGIGREELGAWINRWLGERFQVYAVRTRAYMDMLQAELDSENGHVYGWFDHEELAALEGRWGIVRQEQRFLYCLKDEWLEPEVPARPAIMARITDLGTMMQVISVNEDCPCEEMEVILKVRDSLIPGNDGLWRWRLDGYGSSLRRMEPGMELKESGEEAEAEMWAASAEAYLSEAKMPEEKEPPVSSSSEIKSLASMSLPMNQSSAKRLCSTEVLEVTIEQLTSWIFGYSELEDPPFWCRYVRPLHGVFLDEVV